MRVLILIKELGNRPKKLRDLPMRMHIKKATWTISLLKEFLPLINPVDRSNR